MVHMRRHHVNLLLVLRLVLEVMRVGWVLIGLLAVVLRLLLGLIGRDGLTDRNRLTITPHLDTLLILEVVVGSFLHDWFRK